MKRTTKSSKLVSLAFLTLSVGSGAYGTVVSAEDSEAADEESRTIAIKKIERAFEHPLFAKRTLRELKILRLLSHENVRPNTGSPSAH